MLFDGLVLRSIFESYRVVLVFVRFKNLDLPEPMAVVPDCWVLRIAAFVALNVGPSALQHPRVQHRWEWEFFGARCFLRLIAAVRVAMSDDLWWLSLIAGVGVFLSSC